MAVGDLYAGLIANGQRFPASSDRGTYMMLQLSIAGEDPLVAGNVEVENNEAWGMILSASNPLTARSGADNKARYSVIQVA